MLELNLMHMKKLLTIALLFSFTLAGQVTLADGHGNGKNKGKAKGKPAFVDKKHRAHEQWKREKEYEKEYRKRSKKHDDHDDDRWERSREDDRRQRDREEQRRREPNRRNENRTLGQIILDGVQESQNRRN
jgi:hypothetical protein